MPNIVNKKRYDNCMKMIGQIDAIRSLIEGLEGIDDITEEEYDENVCQASNLLFRAGMILESSSKIERDDLFTFEVFLDDIELRDILVFQRMVNTEVDRRVGIMDRR